MVSVDEELLRVLACPICKNDLVLEGNKFVCKKDKSHVFGFTAGFPDFIIE